MLLDSGCTYYVCPKRKWFSAYKPYDGDSVLMKNNAVCKTVGIGNIRMRMFDGQVRTLTNIWHVLNLKKNLLSLKALKARGYKFSGADGGIKVTKGSMMILKREQQQRRRIQQDFGTCVLDTWASEVFKPYTTKVLYQMLQTWSL